MSISATETTQNSFEWSPQPEAAALVGQLLDGFVRRHRGLSELNQKLLLETGTRLLDWVDHLVIVPDEQFAQDARRVGYDVESTSREGQVWRNTSGMFPPLVTANPSLHDGSVDGVAIKVECVDFFLKTHGLEGRVRVIGEVGGQLQIAQIDQQGGVGFWIVERHGYSGFELPKTSSETIAAAHSHFEQFKNRQRKFDEPAEGFAHARKLIQAAQADIGVDWSTDLFFAAERIYWQSRNQAAQAQYARQQKLGLGWANHDHHTYRSSRKSFYDLISILELMGYKCRERFYAGREAGWGAQVLEQTACGLCVFADVDLSPDEVADDFAHQRLPERDHLGTVGLWCELHGEAFLEAGMHHLEAQFSFDAAREQLKQAAINSMAPFTNFPFLRQGFTVGERWQVDPARIDKLLAAHKITAEQAEKFRRDGAIGSHLEVLERNDGYKGFNQTGISDIIHRTDPRRGA